MELTRSEQFFYDNAGYSWRPSSETEDEGKRRCAIESASAEARALTLGMYLDVEQDGDEYAWHGENFEVITGRSEIVEDAERWQGFTVNMYDRDTGKVLASLYGVTFKDNNPHDSYRRVVYAELAAEALAAVAA